MGCREGIAYSERDAYSGRIEPMPNKAQWPHVDLLYEVAAPLGKRPVGRQRKLRRKGFMEGGSTSAPKAGQSSKVKQMVRGPDTCKRCGEVGHRQSSYKCPFNGTKKRKRKSRSRKFANSTAETTNVQATAETTNVQATAEDENVQATAETTNVQASPAVLTRSMQQGHIFMKKKLTPKKKKKKKSKMT